MNMFNLWVKLVWNIHWLNDFKKEINHVQKIILSGASANACNTNNLQGRD
jgi:hypothetical protein